MDVACSLAPELRGELVPHPLDLDSSRVAHVLSHPLRAALIWVKVWVLDSGPL